MAPKRLLRIIFAIISLLFATCAWAQEDALYEETFRPQFHYSPPCKWMNDPNGLVYDNGEYHLFYQFNPTGLTWGPMHWGHAASTDLVHWETLPIALYPDENGTIFSGSIVIDNDNTAGFGAGTMVAVYSYDTQTQGVAYSTDNGRTWTKYADNPIMDALAPDFRDPKVFWHDATEQWIMSIAAGREIRFFRSSNLIDWKYLSSFSTPGTAGTWEVPDLFSLNIDGETKWVLIVSINAGAPAGGSGTMYFIGDFDGETFTLDKPQEILWLDYGADNYAGTTFYNAPDNKRIHIGWMNNWTYAEAIPTSTWRGSMTIPRELSLINTPGGLRLVQTPVPVLAGLRDPIGSWTDITLSGVLELDGIQGRRLEIMAEMDAGTAARSGISVHHHDTTETRIMYSSMVSQVLIVRSSQAGDDFIGGFMTLFGAPVTLDDNRLKLHILVDESSIEVFVNDGTTVLTSRTFGDPSANGVTLFAEEGEAIFSSVEVYSLRSVWSTQTVSASQYPDFCN